MSTLVTDGRFAARMQTLPRSCVREIMSAAADRELISLAGGLPQPSLFPVDAITQAALAVLHDESREALQYGPTEGCRALRRFVAERLLAPRGIQASPDDVLITSGSQQGLDLLGKVFLDQGDTVLLESPSYLAAIQAFALYQPRFRTVPLGPDGLDPAALAKRLQAGPSRLLYVIPDFQNPTGISYSEAVRRRVIALLRDGDTVLIEDDPYGELRYEGERLPPLASRLDRGRVLLGTFSKVLAPGLRLGWGFADRAIIDRMVVAKQASDLCSNMFAQKLLCQVLLKVDLDRHIAMLRNAYRAKRDHLLALLEQHFPAGCTWTRPAGGMFVWVTLPAGLSATCLLERCLARGVAFAPGRSFFAEEPQDNTLRLNFTHAAPEAMTQAVAILAAETASLARA